MQNLITKIVKTTNEDFTMSSLDYLNEVINPARVAAGEKPVRNTELLRKIEDECDDLGGLQIFCNPNGTDMKYYDLNYDNLIDVGNRESKAVRKVVREILKEMKKALIDIANSENHEEAVDIATKVVHTKHQQHFINLMKKDAKALQGTHGGHSLTKCVNKFMVSNVDPMAGYEEFLEVYNNWVQPIYGELAPAIRREIFDGLRDSLVSENRGIKPQWRNTRFHERNYDNDMYLKFKDVENAVVKKQSSLRERDKNENIQVAINAKTAAEKAVAIAKKERKENIMMKSRIGNISNKQIWER